MSSSAIWWPFAAVVVLLYQLCFLGTTVVSSEIMLGNETDRWALLEFKSMISSDPLEALSSWNDSTHFCQWYGVSCSRRSDDGGRVTVLDLHSQKLVGSISPHIGNLSFLAELVLSNNSFSEGIPSEIGRLQGLQRLLLDNNSFSGGFPSNISGCSALVEFDVDNNILVGEIPWSIASLNKLQEFHGALNNLSGSIPPSFGNLSSLQILRLNHNRLSGRVPSVIGQLKSLRLLHLQVNNLHGEIPASIFNLSSLTSLRCGMNELQDNLPMDLGISVPNLQVLDVAMNQYTGLVPASLSNASNLVELQLQNNNFFGSMPSLESSHNLEYLYIQFNSLGSGKANDLSFISSLTNASSLKWLIINRNNFGGSLPEQIGNLSTNLEVLGLGENKLSGSIPRGIENLASLQWFDASSNNLSGTIPSNIGNMQTLQQLTISQNSISGFVPSSIGNLTKLLALVLDNNHLQGEIPVAIENCKNLIALDLSYNNLSGVIPSQVMSLSSLSLFLNLSNNRFFGALPNEVGHLQNLGSLDVSHNMLSGEIPSSLGSCIMLESLSLQGNLFKGTIPSSLGSLRGIQQLDISSNDLSGQIPRLFEGMKQLELLNLSYNNFEGEVSLSGVFKNTSIISIVGNTKLCGGKTELNLSPCLSKHRKKSSSHKLKIVVSTISGVFFLIGIGSCLLIFLIKRKGTQDTITIDDLKLQLSYRNLYKATNGFSSANLIGVGSFGSVYKGVIHSNEVEKTIAVKVFNLQRSGASRSFMAECAALRNIRHRNIVKILTACSGVDYQGNDFKALTYDLMANGSLEDWLHSVESGDEPPRRFNFSQRLNVAIDVASAIDYLHYYCENPIIHCDLKPSNVLLDKNMVAHVGDFGSAKFVRSVTNPSLACETSSSIGLNGTIGYTPPEYGTGHEVSTQGDMYSYGVLLLEMFTGRRPTDVTFNECVNIRGFVKDALLEKSITKAVDPVLSNELRLGRTTHCNTIIGDKVLEEPDNINGQMTYEVLISVHEIGVACSSDSPHERMNLSEVVTRLVSLRKLLLDESH